ncbi:hypothetical protein D3C85_1689140 [compost metagenome]
MEPVVERKIEANEQIKREPTNKRKLEQVETTPAKKAKLDKATPQSSKTKTPSQKKTAEVKNSGKKQTKK